ncbi:DUF4917 family protein [Xenorhabdus innexi]|uniref:DUF4917 domain-containing protein n=1 Tax=Xenorhabdus innexi TaxID=290109 RepID=A0A1N6MRX9_9GAMM|nr:DUF4917 family protein [Xenorhabdus innexi]PHM38571.1 hypothetical protein Xinn_00268 [Xenorhabdus innexi]SIP71581.1 conserved hypothetical protein [Xenorhabdus innexi]
MVNHRESSEHDYNIYSWSEIPNYFKVEHLLIGNGASISLDKNFNYETLKDYVVDNIIGERELLKKYFLSLFEKFNTDDFELILRLVWQAAQVNYILDVKGKNRKLIRAYKGVRISLIKAVQGIHSEHSNIEWHFKKIATFLCSFQTIFSLNYDLILYWVTMYSNKIDRSKHQFKDCFDQFHEFRRDWQTFRNPYPWGSQQKSTLVFYPHGNLMLIKNIAGKEYKISNREDSNNLLDTILDTWEEGKYSPLFVSEGNSRQKIESIENSYYLNTVYQNVIPSLWKCMTIYGWAFGEHDIHILKQIGESQIEELAVSVFGKDDNAIYRNHVIHFVEKYINHPRRNNRTRHNKKLVTVRFFDCESQGCWKN